MRGEAAAAAAAWALGAWCASGVIAPEAADCVEPHRRVRARLVAGRAAGRRADRWPPSQGHPLEPSRRSGCRWSRCCRGCRCRCRRRRCSRVGPLGQLLAATSALASVVAAASERRGSMTRVRGLAIPVLLLAALFSASAWWVSPRIPGGDEPHYLIITQSLLADGDLRIEDNHRRREYAAYADGELKPDYLRRGRDGAIYSIHAPGVSALVLPAFWLAGYPGRRADPGRAERARPDRGLARGARRDRKCGAAAVATAGVGLSVPFFFQTFTIYPDGPAAVGVAAVVWLGARPARAPTWQRALACGALLGVLPWLHTRYGAIAGPLGLVVAGRLLWPREPAPWPSRPRAGRARAAGAGERRRVARDVPGHLWHVGSTAPVRTRDRHAVGAHSARRRGSAARSAVRPAAERPDLRCSRSPGLRRCGGATAG